MPSLSLPGDVDLESGHSTIPREQPAHRSAGTEALSDLWPGALARIRAEENLLRAQFGGEYDAYRARTRRLIPGLY